MCSRFLDLTPAPIPNRSRFRYLRPIPIPACRLTHNRSRLPFTRPKQ
jgi:hypothetical protein